jgi:hypothetical protein
VESKDDDKDSGEVVHCGLEYCADTVLFWGWFSDWSVSLSLGWAEQGLGSC